MRVTCIPHPLNAEILPFVGESNHHMAWTPDQAGHVALASAGLRSVGGLTLHTGHLEPNALRQICDALAPLAAVGPALPEIAQDGIEVLVTTSDALDCWRDSDATKGSRLFHTAKAAAKAEEALLHILTPFVPGLKCVEPWNGCITVLIKAGDEIFALHPEYQRK